MINHLKIMHEEEDDSRHWNTPYYQLQLYNQTVKTPGATYGTFIRVNTEIYNFKPIYLISEKSSLLVDRKKNSKKNIEMNSKEQKIQKILKFGSQLFFKVRIPSENFIISNSFPQPQIMKPFMFPNGQETVFVQMMMNELYLTKTGDLVQLKEEYSSEAIWVMEVVQKNKVKICSISGNGYLEIRCSKNKKSSNNKFSLCPGQISPIFHIQMSQNNSNHYLLTQLNFQSPTSSKKNFSQKKESQFNGHNLNQSFHDESTFQVHILPVNNSVASLWYQLTFAIQCLKNHPSLQLIKAIIQEMIFYNINQFADNEGLISEHIQTIFVNVGISALMFSFLSKQISQYRHKYTQMSLQSNHGEAQSDLQIVISKHIKLLCFRSKQNSDIFWPLIPLMLDSVQFCFFIPFITKMIRHNHFFIQKYQLKNFHQLIINKIHYLYTTRNFQPIQKIYQLLAEFCKGPNSIPNKYLIMHTFHRLEFSKKKNRMISDERNGQNTLPWLHMYGQGMYVFTQTLQSSGSQDQYAQLELNTYLQQSEQAETIFVGQLSLLAAFCEGYNINAIQKYTLLMRSLTPYCFSSNFPGFQKILPLNATLQAITATFDSTLPYQRLQNGYLLGVIFSNSQQPKESNRNSNSPDILKIKGSRPNHSHSKMFRTTFEQNNVNAFAQDLESLFRNFEISLKRVVNDNKQNIKDYILDMSSIQGSFVLWMKLVRVVIDLKLFPFLKKKEAPYFQYLKKIFQNTNFRKSRSKTPKKDGLQSSISQNKTIKEPNIADNQYDPSANVILQVISRIIKYNPSYQFYLQVFNISRQGGGKSNKDKFIEKVFKIKNSSVSTYFKEVNSGHQKGEQKNSLIFWAFKNNEPNVNERLMKKLNEVKEICFEIQGQIYQKILEEQINYAVETLAYLVKNPSHLSTNKYELTNGLKKLPFTDENNRMALLQNWFLASNPTLLDRVTANLRYVYEQNQIYVRLVSMVLIVCEKETLQFYQNVVGWMSQLYKVSTCVDSWLRPAILLASAEYEKNYEISLRNLENLNNYLGKMSFENHLYLMDCQKILQNLKLLDIFINFSSWLILYENSVNKNPQITQIITSLLQQITKLIQFYIFDSQENRKKILIIAAKYITKSHTLFPILIAILSQSKHPCIINQLLDQQIFTNIVKMLPHSKDYLQFLLTLDQASFIKSVYKLTESIMSLTSQQHQFQNRLHQNAQCSQIICKIAYKILQITNCAYDFITWFYDQFTITYLIKETKTNLHFKSKIIQTLPIENINLQSSFAYLLYKIYFDTHVRLKSHASKDQNQLLVIQSNEGKDRVAEYLLNQILATFLQKNSSILKKYIEYFLFDLLPLLRLSIELLRFDQVQNNLLKKIQEYLQVYEEILQRQPRNLIFLGQSKIVKNSNRTHSDKMEESERQLKKIKKKNDWSKPLHMTLNRNDFERQRILITLSKFIEQKHFDEQFSPRPIALLFEGKFYSTKMGNISGNTWIKSENDEMKKNSSTLNDEAGKLGKKALKKWYKARHSLHQDQQYMVGHRLRFLTDLQNLEYQFLLENEEMKERVINGKDLISKMIKIITEFHRIQLSKENQVFICKMVLLWLQQTIQETKKDSPKKKRKYSRNNAFQIKKQVFLIKNYAICDTISDIMEQIWLKTKNQKTSVLCICYLLKILHHIHQLDSISFMIAFISEFEKVAQLINHLGDAYHFHRQLIQQFQSSYSLDYMSKNQLVDTCWSPLVLIVNLLNKVIVNVHESEEFIMNGNEYQILCSSVVKTRIKIGKMIMQKDLVEIDECIGSLEGYQNSHFQKITIQLRYYDEFYSTLASLQ